MVTGRKLLLADDSATIRKVVELTFSDEGLEVIAVGDGRQALEKLDEMVPDIVLADIFMPEPDGYEICEYIKRTERFRHIPVMLLVGSFEPFDEAEARRVGADDYLTKPFQSIRALVGKVRDLLSGGGGSNEAPTRKLTLPPEAEPESRVDEESLKRATADTAPLPNHEQEEMPRSGNMREGAFTDLSMDDQMIEATPASDYNSQSVSPSARDAQDVHQTAAYTAADLQEPGIKQALESEDAPRQEVVSSGAYAPTEANEPTPVAVAGYVPTASRASSRMSSDDALLDLGDIEPPTTATTEADDFFLDLLDESPTQAQASAPNLAVTSELPVEAAPPSSTAEEMDAQARSFDEPQTLETRPQAQEFVEPQVVSEESRTEFAPAQDETSPLAEDQSAQESSVVMPADLSGDRQLAPTERLPHDFQTAQAPAETSGAEQNVSANTSGTNQITLEQLSPEVIDAIARRAVEHLSARVVEQIAWEVVPELAELLIKRRLEEGKQ